MKKLKKVLVIFLMMLLFTSCASNISNVNEEQEPISVTEEDTSKIDSHDSNSVEDESVVSESSTTSIKKPVVPSEKEEPEQLSELQVHFIDVGQGDSTLIMCDGHSMLIDTGDDSKGTAIQNYLMKQGVEKLDYLILTHPDTDHIGGAPVIITKFDIDNVFMSNYEKDNKNYMKVIQALDNKLLKWSTPTVGNNYNLGSASITILAPNKVYDNPNNASIALIVENGNNRFLFTGDAEETAEADILNNGLNVNADVYQVGHHGSKTSSSKSFLNAVSPTYAVISCAEGNSYGHPHAETLNNLRSMGMQVFRTDEQGSIVAISDGNEITWNCAPSDTWQAGEPTGSPTDNTNNNVVNNPEQTIGENTNTEPELTSEPEQDAVVIETPVEEPESIETPIETSSSATYICNTNTGKFHYPSCSSVSQMAEKNKLEVTITRDELINQGYVPCKRCNP